MFELFMLQSCPYCRKVIDYFHKNNINFLSNDISDSKYRAELLSLGGKEQVPYLFDSDKKYGLYESDEIIKYLENEGKDNE